MAWFAHRLLISDCISRESMPRDHSRPLHTHISQFISAIINVSRQLNAWIMSDVTSNNKLAWLMLLTAKTNCQNWPALSPLSHAAALVGPEMEFKSVKQWGERRETLRQTNSLPQPLQIALCRYGAVVDTSFHCVGQIQKD